MPAQSPEESHNPTEERSHSLPPSRPPQVLAVPPPPIHPPLPRPSRSDADRSAGDNLGATPLF